MILQALYDYYQRKAADPESSVAPMGWEKKEIKFIIKISKDGTFRDLIDTRENKTGHFYLVPKSIGRSGSNSWQTAYLLWDHYGYVLGHSKDESEKSRKMAKKQHNSFINNINSLPPHIQKDDGIKAILSFYYKNQIEKVKAHSLWIDCASVPGCNLTFQLDNENTIIVERETIKEYISTTNLNNNENVDKGNTEGCCLITGKKSIIQRKHTATPISGSKSTAKIVSFQKNSGYDSYGREQAFNAPISIEAEEAYSTALKVLLDKESTNKFYFGEMTIVCWTEKTQKDLFDLEENFRWYIDDSPKDDPDKGLRSVKALFESYKTGKIPLDENNRFFVLGLSPSGGRIAIRFWKIGTVSDFAYNIKRHFDDLDIIHSDFEIPFCMLNAILSSISIEIKDPKKSNKVYFKGKFYDVPPNLAGRMVECILDGTPYPQTLLNLCINRIRAEVAKKDQNGKTIQNVTRTRAAILKACINRSIRFDPHNKLKEVTMSLDPENKNIGYLLGRLFAVLEKIQEKSAGGYGKLNSTIRDRYYSSFSSTPVLSMPILLKLKNHHIAKLNIWERRKYEDMITEINRDIDAQGIPNYMTLQNQATFAIGYYHQRYDLNMKPDLKK